MSATEEDIGKWLEQEEPVEDVPPLSDDDIGAYIDKEPESTEPVVGKVDAWHNPIADIGAGATDTFLNLLDIPNSVYNWASEKLDGEYRFPSTRDLGAELNMGYAEGEEPDTGSYRAGEYIALGLEFLAPILKVGTAVRTGVSAANTVNPSLARGVTQTMAKPFTQAPKLALGAEVTSSVASGYGSHYGEEEFGWKGEQIGGLLGAGLPAIGSIAWKASSNYIAKSFFPMSDVGSKSKAGDAIRKLRGSPEVIANVETQMKNTLEGTVHTSARLSKEPYLIALEKALIHDDPDFSHRLTMIDAENNAISKVAMKELGGDGAIEDAMKSLSSRYTKLKVRLDLKVDSALTVAKDAAAKVAPKLQRKFLNMEVKKQIDTALTAARKSENSVWGEVDKAAMAPTQETKSSFLNVLTARELEDDPSDIPAYLHTFLGRLDKKTGKLKGGKYTENRHVGGLQQLRSRLLQTIRSEKAGETPNWNKVRILEDIEDAILQDMGNSNAGSKTLEDAIKFSRELNQKFKGDIMSMILRNNKTGGSLAPELTLESLGAGPKGAFHIKRILAASPESKGNIEDVLKMDIVQQKIVKNGSLNIEKANDYMRKNEQIMEIFPALREDMDNAILQAELHKYFEGSAAVRLKKAESALGFSLADKTNPGRFITKILASKNPEETMVRVLRQVNDEGKAGIKKDVIDVILAKSEVTELIGKDETFKQSGSKALGYWNKNKEVLSSAFDEGENKRLGVILNTLRLGDDPKDIPVDVAKAILAPQRTVLGYVVEVAAARGGAMLGSGTSGASLKTASQGANTARALMAKFDSGTAKKLLKDSILDKELFIELSKDMNKFTGESNAFNVIQGWMVAHAIKSLEQKEELEE